MDTKNTAVTLFLALTVAGCETIPPQPPSKSEYCKTDLDTKINDQAIIDTAEVCKLKDQVALQRHLNKLTTDGPTLNHWQAINPEKCSSPSLSPYAEQSRECISNFTKQFPNTTYSWTKPFMDGDFNLAWEKAKQSLSKQGSTIAEKQRAQLILDDLSFNGFSSNYAPRVNYPLVANSNAQRSWVEVLNAYRSREYFARKNPDKGYSLDNAQPNKLKDAWQAASSYSHLDDESVKTLKTYYRLWVYTHWPRYYAGLADSPELDIDEVIENLPRTYPPSQLAKVERARKLGKSIDVENYIDLTFDYPELAYQLAQLPHILPEQQSDLLAKAADARHPKASLHFLSIAEERLNNRDCAWLERYNDAFYAAMKTTETQPVRDQFYQALTTGNEGKSLRQQRNNVCPNNN